MIKDTAIPLASLALLLGGGGFAKGEVQFDVFMGFAGQARQGEWFPVTFEVYNDGPTFEGQIELRPRFGNNPVYRYKVELTTNTRKRFTFPIFGDVNSGWSARLRNGPKTLAKHDDLKLDSLDSHIILVGALSGQQSGGPVLPKTRFKRASQNKQFTPRVANLQLDTFPDDPITLEGLQTLYLNSVQAIKLRPEQAAAISTWVLCGGHLILAVDQPNDVTSTEWLSNLVRGRFGPVKNTVVGQSLNQWLAATGYPDISRSDNIFAASQFPAATVQLSNGSTLLELDNRPVAAKANRGLGQVSVLGFNSEREPFKSWTNRAWFWARLAQIETFWFGENAPQRFGQTHIDGVFGAMLDSRQISKLPVAWLLLLLATYLVIIGPVDRIWLKRINKQMLTWLTFPAYVVIFSLLIYFIGYKLRGGQLEKNELHVVDVLPNQENMLRGRSYMSIYSPVNGRYQLGGNFAHSAIRSEYGGVFRGNLHDTLQIEYHANGFDADAKVPIWTSRLVSSEWIAQTDAGVTATLKKNNGDGYELAVYNQLKKAITGAVLLVEGKITEIDLQSLPDSESVHNIQTTNSPDIKEKFRDNSQNERFQNAVNARNRAFGNTETSRIEPELMNLVRCSFAELLKTQDNQPAATFISSDGIDLSAHIQRDGAILFLLAEDHSPISSIGQFKTQIDQEQTLYRIPLEPITSR